MPNITFDSLDVIPDGLKEHAKQTDGKFVVDVVPGSKLAEFRENNIRISQERDALGAVVQKLKPVVGDNLDAFLAQYGELKVVAQKVQDGTLKASDAIEAELANRVAQMKTGYESQLSQTAQEAAALRNQVAAAEQKYNRSIVERGVTEAVLNERSGANPGALSDILARAYSVFQVDANGKLVARDGDAVIYGNDGATPMTPLEWMAKLRATAPYLFKNSNGGGATGNNGANSAFGGISQQDFAKMSPEAKLAHAHRMKKSAGTR